MNLEIPASWWLIGAIGALSLGCSRDPAASAAPDVALEPPTWQGDEMVGLPAGAFVMGCDGAPPRCAPSEQPPHEVVLGAFAIDRAEVAQRSYQRCVTDGACERPRHADEYAPEQTPDRAVTGVTWAQAGGYCGWMHRRLPTEAEWERAARGTQERTYPWGDAPPTCERVHGSFCPPRSGPVAVGQKPLGATPDGVLDLAGGVREWVADRYRADWYARSPKLAPQGPTAGAERVVRGLEDGAEGYRATLRVGLPPDRAEPWLGFRCALTLGPPGETATATGAASR